MFILKRHYRRRFVKLLKAEDRVERAAATIRIYLTSRLDGKTTLPVDLIELGENCKYFSRDHAKKFNVNIH